MSSFYDNSPGMVPLGDESKPAAQPAKGTMQDALNAAAAKKRETATATATEKPATRMFENSNMLVGDGAETRSAPEPAAEINVPDNIAKLRSDEGEGFYDVVGTYRSVLGTGTAQDLLPGQPEPVIREVATMFRDAGLTSSEAQQVVDVLKSQPSAEVKAQWLRDTTRFLDTISDADARAAVALLDRDPRVAHVLEQTGAINNPEIAKLIVDKARTERSRGRL